MKFHETRREPPKQPHWEKEREWEIPIGHQSRYCFIYTVIMIMQHVVITQHNNWNCIYFLCKITFAQTRWKFKFYLFFKKNIRETQFDKKKLNQTVNAIVFLLSQHFCKKALKSSAKQSSCLDMNLKFPMGLK